MPSLSLCMIVRDEEPLVPQFLSHVAGLYDQLVVVDTGSVDRTAELFAAAGAEVHSWPWRDDFSDARNESLRYARGDWVLVLDADEFPEPGFAEEVRALIARDDVGAANILRHDEQKNGIVRKPRPLRLFRNVPTLRYRYRIHEDPGESVHAMLRDSGRRLAQVETPVRHIGYLPLHMQSRDKMARDERLLRLALTDDPDDLYSRYKLLELYRFWERPDAMTPVAGECRALIERGIPIVPAHIAGDLVDMMRMGLFPKDLAAGIAFLTAMAPVAAHCGHYHLALGALFEDAKDSARAEACFVQAQSVAEGDPARTQIMTRALTGRTRLALAGGNLLAARTHAQAAAHLSPDDAETQLALQILSQIPATGG